MKTFRLMSEKDNTHTRLNELELNQICIALKDRENLFQGHAKRFETAHGRAMDIAAAALCQEIRERIEHLRSVA